MAIQWNFEHDIHGRYVTCQRPIVFTTYCSDVTVTYFKAQMYIKNGEGNWEETDVIAKGYHDMNDFNYYHFNVAEYVRNYFVVSKGWLNQDVCLLAPIGDTYQWSRDVKFMFQRDFQFLVWPVIVTADGSVDELTNTAQWTHGVSVVELNTKQNEITCAAIENKTRIDNFVNGTMDGSYESNTWGEADCMGSAHTRLMTNMPGMTIANAINDVGGPYNTIYTEDGLFNASLVSPWIYNEDRFVMITYQLRDIATGVYSSYNISTIAGCPLTYSNNFGGADSELFFYQINPYYVDFILTDIYGAGDYIFDTNGDLVSDQIKILARSLNVSNYLVYRSGPKYTFNITDNTFGRCGTVDKRVKFVFKNMRGGIDWFSSTGTLKKEVEVGSTMYEQNQRFGRGGYKSPIYGDAFGVAEGEHSRTNLWTQRTEKFEVMTQALTTPEVEWLEELIVSPQVWIEQEREYNTTDEGGPKYPKNRILVPIIIDTGSYKVYNSEEQVFYMEFSYTLSDNTLTQIGY